MFSKADRLAVFMAWVLPLPQLLRWDAAYAERWVGAIRREVLDRMLISDAGSCDRCWLRMPALQRPPSARALGQAPPVGPNDSAVVPTGRPSYSFDRSDRCVGFST